MRSLAGRGIQIHSHEAGVRKKTMQLSFDALRSESSVMDVDPLALRTRLRRILNPSTIMTPKVTFREVIRERNVTIAAHLHITAVGALDDRSESAAILQ